MAADNSIMLTGATGFLGWQLLQLMLARGLSPVVTEYRTPLTCPGLNSHQVDLSSFAEVRRLVKHHRPSIVIHCAALTQVDACEQDRELAERCNVLATENLLKALEGQARFIYLSTDLVFDGLRRNYREDDAVKPISVYSRTKQAGEELTRELAPNHAVVRASLIYGPDAPNRACFLSWMHEGCRKGSLNLFTDEYRTPIYVGDLAQLLLLLTETDFCGDLHAGGPERLSRFEFGLKFCRVFGYDRSTLIKKMLSEVELMSYRPPDASLNIERARSLFDFQPLAVTQGLQRTMQVSAKGKA